jgi:TM2 domain-containing membrane protein YozV
VSTSAVEQLATAPHKRRSPRLARVLSIVPGLGQLYYGAPRRAAQYLAGVVVPALLAALIYSYSFEMGSIHAGAILTSVAFVLSELIVLALVVTLVSFWIAASWDARQGTMALNEGRTHRPVWWFVKAKRFLFDDPDETEEEGE